MSAEREAYARWQAEQDHAQALDWAHNADDAVARSQATIGEMRDVVTALVDLLKRYDNALEMAVTVHGKVAMDTPADIDLHARAMESLRGYQAALRAAAARVAP